MRCLDANVWIYYLDAEQAEHDDVRERVGALVRSKPLFVTTVLQTEVLHYVTNQMDASERTLETFLSGKDVTVADLLQADVERAAELLDTHEHAGIGGRDATVLAAMERHDVSRLWTHDEALKRMSDRLDWLDVIDPVTDRV